MKKTQFALALLAFVCASAASAAVIPLAGIDTNNCMRAQSQIQLLNGPGARVNSFCQYGQFLGHNGMFYNSRLNTTVEVPYAVGPGMRISLANVDTNDCAAAASEVRLLNSRAVTVDTFCEYGTFLGRNGFYYNSRLHTTLILNY